MTTVASNALDPILQTAQDPSAWSLLVLGGGPDELPKLRGRPLQLRGESHVQLTWQEGPQGKTRNHPATDWPEALGTLLQQGYTRLHLTTPAGDWHARRSRKGKWLVSKGKTAHAQPAQTPAHDRERTYPLPGEVPDALLQALEIQDAAGKLRANRRDKFRQINHFLRILLDALETDSPRPGPLSLIDAGCGHAYLTCAAWHCLNQRLDAGVQMIGVDVSADRIEHCNQLRRQLDDPESLSFVEKPIRAFTPPSPPDAVISLHACDTATDEALALAVRWEARHIFCAPCCQHELRDQLHPDALRPVLRHGILKQRVAEILTDACRAQLLRLCGYRVDLLEFIDSKHTPKNLLIRAVRTAHPPEAVLVLEYRQLREQFGIQPALERLLADRLDSLLAS